MSNCSKTRSKCPTFGMGSKTEKEQKSDILFIDLNCDYRLGHPNLSSRNFEITVDVAQSTPTPEWQKTHAKGHQNLCFYTETPRHELKVTPNASSEQHGKPRFFNVFINEKMVALVRVTFVDNFAVSLYPIEQYKVFK